MNAKSSGFLIYQAVLALSEQLICGSGNLQAWKQAHKSLMTSQKSAYGSIIRNLPNYSITEGRIYVAENSANF